MSGSAGDPLLALRTALRAAESGAPPSEEEARRARAAARRLARAPAAELLPQIARMVRRPGRVAPALEALDALGGLGALVPALEACRGVDQSAYHDRDVLGHTLEVVRRAGALAEDPGPVFRSRAPRVAEELSRPVDRDFTAAGALMLGALLHDMAKAMTRGVTPEGRVTFMRHDRIGAVMAAALLHRWGASPALTERVAALVRHHLPLGFLVHRTPLSQRQIEAYLARTAPVATETLVLSAADRLATRGPRTRPSAITRHLALAREVMEVHLDLLDGRRRPTPTGQS